MLSPSPNSTNKPFSRVALVGKFQADGIEEHLRDLAKMVSSLGCTVFLEAATAQHLGLSEFPTKTAEDFAGAIDLVVVLGGDAVSYTHLTLPTKA